MSLLAISTFKKHRRYARKKLVVCPHRNVLREQVRLSPQQPGVYRWVDADGHLLYVGKAKNLRNRLRSYVTKNLKDVRFYKRGLYERMASLEYTVTNTELEALILELHLIRSLRPPYNIALKRSRDFVYVRISLHEDFPSISLTHEKELDGATYFGPFTNTWSQKRMIELFRRILKFRDCRMNMEVQRKKGEVPSFALHTSSFSKESSIPLDVVCTKPDRRIPCFDYQIQQCMAPCNGGLSPEDYIHKCIEPVAQFYRGEFTPVVERLLQEMKTASGERKFERAIDVRDALAFIEQLKHQHILFDMTGISADAVGMVRTEDAAYVSVMHVRGGNVVNAESFVVDEIEGEDASVLSEALVRFYASAEEVPELVLLPHSLADESLVKQWLAHTRGGEVLLTVPKKGSKAKLVDMALKNATIAATRKSVEELSTTSASLTLV